MKTASFSSSRRRQRIVERAAHRGRRHLVGGAADELHARRIGRDHEDDGEFLVLHRDQPVVGDEGVVGQHRAGRHHLGAGDDDAGVGLLLDVAADVGHLVRRPVAVDRRMDDGVVDEGHALLAELVPAPRILLVGIVEVGIGAERRQERRLVVGRAAHPAVGDAGPFGDGVAAGDQLLERLRRLEEGVGHAAVAGVGRQQDLVLALGVVQRVVEARHHAGGVAEGRMRGDVLDALAVDVDLAAVAQRVEIFRAGLRRRRPFTLPVVSGLAANASGFSRAATRQLAIRPRRSPPIVRLSNLCTMSERRYVDAAQVASHEACGVTP